MALVRRKIDVTFALGEGAFGESGTNTVTLQGLRTSARIVKAGGPSMSNMQMEIYGIRPSLMDKLSTLGMKPTLQRRNIVVASAGDDVNGMAVVFQGTITNAWADYQAAPDVAFHVEAHTGLIEAVAPAPAISFRGAADVGVIMSGLASQMQLPFENNGVNVKLANPYFSGSAREQAKACAEAAGINWIIDNGKLVIWPAGQARGGSAPLISPATGLIGYPSYTSKGILLRTIFNPAVGFASKIVVDTSLQPAQGEWVVFTLDHVLESLFPNGSWFSNIGAARPGLGPIVA